MQFFKHMGGLIPQWLLFVVAFGVVIVWGETFVSTKVLLNEGMQPASIFVYRSVIAYLCLLVGSHSKLFSQNLQDELLLVFVGITGASLNFLFENMALQYSTASNVAIVVGITPLMTALLLACFYQDERMNGKQIVCSIIAFVGLILVVLNGQFILHLNPLGDLLALGASLVWGIYSLILKRLSPRYDALFITRKLFGYGLLTIVPWFMLVEPLQTSSELLFRPIVWGNVVYLGVIASSVCFFAWNWVMPRLGVVKTTNIIYSQCVFTFIISTIVLNERITWMAILGTTVLVGGMFLMSKR